MSYPVPACIYEVEYIYQCGVVTFTGDEEPYFLPDVSILEAITMEGSEITEARIVYEYYRPISEFTGRA